MRYFILLVVLLTIPLFSGCADENSQALFEAHVAAWLTDHPVNLVNGMASYVAECGNCHGLNLRGSGGAPSCFSTTFSGNACHAAGPAPHPLDGSFLDENSHGPVAKADLTVCQQCHSSDPSGGPGSNPQFNVGIDSANPPVGIGCEACHSPGYAHPASWAGPLPNTRFHYSAGNIQKACVLCHEAALTSCLGCHAEVVNFTLDCNSCHGQPPAGSHESTIAVGLTVADIIAHDVCLVCHGMKESTTGGTFSNSANYALFNKLTDTIGDHWNGFINMNSDTDYNENTGGCDAAGCHGGGAPHTLPDSGLLVKLGAYGAGAPHPVGQDWLLPSGHVAVADATCVSCHTLSGGGQDPACMDCHVQGDPLVLLNCTSCHAEPPDNTSVLESDRPNRQGAHAVHDSFTPTQGCSACHQGGGTDQQTHYDRLADGTTPDYPADVVLAASLDSNSHGTATYSIGGGTCSGVNCHGGLVTPVWLTGALEVDTQCTNCHQSGGAGNEPNSYTGLHSTHSGETCTDCHNTTNLATNHFTNLSNPAQWLDTAGETIGGGGTSIGTYDDATNSCSLTCHGETRTW